MHLLLLPLRFHSGKCKNKCRSNRELCRVLLSNAEFCRVMQREAVQSNVTPALYTKFSKYYSCPECISGCKCGIKLSFWSKCRVTEHPIWSPHIQSVTSLHSLLKLPSMEALLCRVHLSYNSLCAHRGTTLLSTLISHSIPLQVKSIPYVKGGSEEFWGPK